MDNTPDKGALSITTAPTGSQARFNGDNEFHFEHKQVNHFGCNPSHSPAFSCKSCRNLLSYLQCVIFVSGKCIPRCRGTIIPTRIRVPCLLRRNPGRYSGYTMSNRFNVTRCDRRRGGSSSLHQPAGRAGILIV